MEPLHCRVLGDLVKVSCIERCPHFKGKFTSRKHIWDTAKCPHYRGVLISGVAWKRGSTVHPYYGGLTSFTLVAGETEVQSRGEDKDDRSHVHGSSGTNRGKGT